MSNIARALLAAPPTAPADGLYPEFSPALFAFPSLLRKGAYDNSARAAINSLQGMLWAALGKQIDVDGQFGTATDLAVREFQQRAGIVVDGIVGPETRGALKALMQQARTGTPDARWDAEVISRVRSFLGLTGMSPAHASKSEPMPTWLKVVLGGAAVVGAGYVGYHGYKAFVKRTLRKGVWR